MRFVPHISARLAPIGGSPALGTALALVAIALAAACAAVPGALRAAPGIDDVNWASRALSPWWFAYPHSPRPGWPAERDVHYHDQKWTSDCHRQYYYAVDHPALPRIVYGAVLRTAGISEVRAGSWDNTITPAANMALGHVLPYRAMVLLRMTNFALFLGALVLAYFAASAVLRNRALAAAAVLPVALEPSMSGPLGVVQYIGADALLVFALVLLWFVWLRLRQPGWKAAILLGALAALAASAKMSGVFALAGVMAYLAACAKGRRRMLLPAAAALSSAVFYLALNPLFFGGGLAWAAQVFRDTVEMRFFVKSVQLSDVPRAATRLETILGSLPYLYLFLPVAAVLYGRRREAWFAPTAFWSGSILLLNALFLYRPVAKYAAPLRAAFLLLFMTAGLRLVQEMWKRRLERRGASTREPAVGHAARTEAR